MREIYIQCSDVNIGYRGENLASAVTFDLSDMIKTWGEGEAVLMVKRPMDTVGYPAATTRDGEILTWTPTATDTQYKGHGVCELFWYVNDVLAKSELYTLVIEQDIGDPGTTPPDPYEDWIERLTELGAETQANAHAAETARDEAEDAADRAEAALSEFTSVTAEAETLPPGSDATASYDAGVLTFGIPRGDKGETGATPDFEIGDVETLEPGQPAVASITGTPEKPVLNLGLPKGEPGDMYDKADAIVCGASGDVVSFPDGANDTPLRELVVDIQPVQEGSGEPSTENVRPIRGWTGATVYVSPTTDSADADIYDISWEQEAGTVYGGMLDVLRGVLTVTWEAATYDGSSDENWGGSRTSGWYVQNDLLMKKIEYEGSIISDKYPTGRSNKHISGYADRALRYPDNNWIYIYDTDIETNAALREYLASNPLTASFELAHPVTYQLTPTEVRSLLGQNYVWADCGDVDLQYRADTKMYIDGQGGGGDYDALTNKPKIDGTTLTGNKELSDIGIKIATTAEIESILYLP